MEPKDPVASLKWTAERRHKPIAFIPEIPPGPTFDMPATLEPVQLFLKLWPQAVFDLMVTQSNLFAERNDYRLNTNSTELKAFVGIVLIMGVSRQSSIDDYWRNPIGSPIISKSMARSRFEDLQRYLHFNDTFHMVPDPMPPLFRIQPLLDILRHTFETSYVPGEFVTVDEGMIPFSGKTELRSYMPRKPTHNGVLVDMATDAECGYVFRFRVDSKRKRDRTPVESRPSKASQELLTNVLDSGRTVILDRAYTAIPLASVLFDRKTKIIGTFMANRRGFPPS
jgi:hypothetical protein